MLPRVNPPQAERWGSELYFEDVEEVDLAQRPFVIRNTERELRTNAVIIATGATARRLNLPSEEKFWSKGISACAICDGEGGRGGKGGHDVILGVTSVNSSGPPHVKPFVCVMQQSTRSLAMQWLRPR